MTCAGPSSRTQRLLALVRPYVDEIMLAGDRDILERCGASADFTLELVPDRSELATRLQQACGCDWLLCCGDDEVPSRALLQALRTLSSARRLTHYALTHRWLHRARDNYVYSPPWQPDFAPRIVRRDARETGQQQLVDLPIYRTELLLVSEQARRVRALAQERLAPEALREGAAAGAMLVPEDWEGLVMGTVPEPDRLALAYVLEAGAAALQPEEVPAASTDASDRPAAGAATIEFIRPVTRMPAGVCREQEVLVRNDGHEPWPWRDEQAASIRLGYRWHMAGDSGRPGEEGPRTLFTEAIEPGGCSLALLAVQAPEVPGRYVLEVDVVEEHVRWFGCAARMEVEVDDRRGDRSAPAGRRRAFVAEARTHGLATLDAVRDHRRWMAGQRAAATPLSDRRPWLTFGAQDALAQALGSAARVCEYGSGGSTLFALDRAADLVSIDWDADWSARVGDAVAPDRRAAWTLELVAPEPDERAARLDPSDPSACVSASPAFSNFSFRSYARAIERYADGTFDVVLVAGRARPACVRHALAKVAPGGLLVLDHSERPWYGAALALAAPAQWSRVDHRGPGPYAERFWQTTILRRAR